MNPRIVIAAAVVGCLLAAIVGCLLAAIAVQTLRLGAEQKAHADTRAGHAEQLRMLANAGRNAEAAARAEEQRRSAELQKVANEATHALDRARADAAAAAAAGQRLRDRLATVASACRAGPGDPVPAAPGPAASSPADLLAYVQRRLDEAADGIARHADAAGAAGRACERAYDSLTRRSTAP